MNPNNSGERNGFDNQAFQGDSGNGWTLKKIDNTPFYVSSTGDVYEQMPEGNLVYRGNIRNMQLPPTVPVSGSGNNGWDLGGSGHKKKNDANYRNWMITLGILMGCIILLIALAVFNIAEENNNHKEHAQTGGARATKVIDNESTSGTTDRKETVTAKPTPVKAVVMPKLKDFLYYSKQLGSWDINDENKMQKMLKSKGFQKAGKNTYELKSGGTRLLTVTLRYDDVPPEIDETGEEYYGGGVYYLITLKFANKADANAFSAQWHSINTYPKIIINQSGNTVSLELFDD